MYKICYYLIQVRKPDSDGKVFICIEAWCPFWTRPITSRLFSKTVSLSLSLSNHWKLVEKFNLRFHILCTITSCNNQIEINFPQNYYSNLNKIKFFCVIQRLWSLSQMYLHPHNTTAQIVPKSSNNLPVFESHQQWISISLHRSFNKEWRDYHAIMFVLIFSQKWKQKSYVLGFCLKVVYKIFFEWFTIFY